MRCRGETGALTAILRFVEADSKAPGRGDQLASAVVRGLGLLPERVQRLAGGRPIQIDGQRLDPEVQLVLRLTKLSPRPSFDTLPVAEAREEIRREATAFAGPRIPVASETELTVSGADGPLRARLYVPNGAPPRSPLLVYFHGGGWVVGDLDTHDQTCRFLAREASLRVLAVAYRRAPEHPFPAPVEDALAAFRSAVQQASSLGADSARVAVGGDSAGGNLAAAVAQLAVADGGPVPAFQLLIYPVTDLSRKRRSYELFGDGFFLTERQMDWYRHHYLPGPSSAADPRASPLLREDLAGLPPAHVAIAGFDVLRDEVEEYVRRLDAAGVPVTVSRHNGLIHGFCNAVAVGRACPRAMLDVASSLRRYDRWS